MASDRCACGCHDPVHGFKGCSCCPAPREAGAILTREEFEAAIRSWASYLPEWECGDRALVQTKFLAHDAALRAENERLTRERDQQERFKWKANERAGAAEAERDRLMRERDYARKMEMVENAGNAEACRQLLAVQARADAAEREVERAKRLWVRWNSPDEPPLTQGAVNALHADYNALKARADRLAEALREIHDHADTLVEARRIAAAALKREEKNDTPGA